MSGAPAAGPAWVGEGGCLAVGGVPVTRLAERVGDRPFFAYDRARLTARAAELRRALPPGVELSYAVKANPMPAVVQHMAGLVDGFDVASAGEMQTALDTPVPAARISFAGPGKTAAELRQAVAAGVLINLESAEQLRLAARIGAELGLAPRVALRINPDFAVRGGGLSMGGGAKAFGIDADQAPALLAAMPGLGVAFEGFHIFGGSQNLHAEAVTAMQAGAIELAVGLARHAPGPVLYLNIGGGFGIPYFANDRPLDLDAVGRTLGPLAERARAALPRARLVVELGRYLVGEAGVYVCRVVDRKVSHGTVFLVTDGGLHHHLAATGNFGQVVRRNYPVVIANRMDEPPCETAEIVGRLCTPIDTLGRAVPVPAARIGDLVAVLQSGAYGPSASPAAFLGHAPPAEILV